MERLTHGFRRFVNAVLFWALVLAGLGLLFLVVALPVVEKRRAMELTAGQMNARNLADADRFDRLRKEEEALRSGDPFYLEKLAREKLHMGRPGEGRLDVALTPEEERRRRERETAAAPEPYGLWQLCNTLDALTRNRFMRQGALVLGALSIIAAVILFGRTRQTCETG